MFQVYIKTIIALLFSLVSLTVFGFILAQINNPQLLHTTNYDQMIDEYDSDASTSTANTID